MLDISLLFQEVEDPRRSNATRHDLHEIPGSTDVPRASRHWQSPGRSGWLARTPVPGRARAVPAPSP